MSGLQRLDPANWSTTGRIVGIRGCYIASFHVLSFILCRPSFKSFLDGIMFKCFSCNMNLHAMDLSPYYALITANGQATHEVVQLPVKKVRCFSEHDSASDSHLVANNGFLFHICSCARHGSSLSVGWGHQLLDGLFDPRHRCEGWLCSSSKYRGAPSTLRKLLSGLIQLFQSMFENQKWTKQCG